jgi:predicted RNA-binding Zn ribbon-like protein
MNFDHYSDTPAGLAEALVNTREAVSGIDALNSVEALAQFLAEHAEPWAGNLPTVADSDLEGVKALREQLRSVFEVADEDRAVGVINAILAENGATPRISTHGGLPHLHFESTVPGLVQWLGVTSAMGLAAVLTDEGMDRLGVCHSDTCEDVYIDTSRNRSRRHCSTTCSTRENVAAHRQRRRGEAEDQSSGSA